MRTRRQHMRQHKQTGAADPRWHGESRHRDVITTRTTLAIVFEEWRNRTSAPGDPSASTSAPCSSTVGEKALAHTKAGNLCLCGWLLALMPRDTSPDAPLRSHLDYAILAIRSGDASAAATRGSASSSAAEAELP